MADLGGKLMGDTIVKLEQSAVDQEQRFISNEQMKKIENFEENRTLLWDEEFDLTKRKCAEVQMFLLTNAVVYLMMVGTVEFVKTYLHQHHIVAIVRLSVIIGLMQMGYIVHASVGMVNHSDWNMISVGRKIAQLKESILAFDNTLIGIPGKNNLSSSLAEAQGRISALVNSLKDDRLHMIYSSVTVAASFMYLIAITYWILLLFKGDGFIVGVKGPVAH